MGSKPNHATSCSWLLWSVNSLLSLFGIFIVVALLVATGASLTPAGWAFFVLGVLTFSAGISGLPKKKGVQSCFCLHTLFLFTGSTALLIAAVLCISKPEEVLEKVRVTKWGSGEQQRGGLRDLGIVFIVVTIVDLSCLLVSCGVFRCLLPEKQPFWHDDYSYRQRALAFHEMKEESELESGHDRIISTESEGLERSKHSRT